MTKTISADQVFTQQTIATLPTPWSLAFLPSGQLLVSELPTDGYIGNPSGTGNIRLVTQSGTVSTALAGLPGNNFGVLDIELSPEFAQNNVVYFTYLEKDPTAPRIGRNVDDPMSVPAGIALARGVLDLSDPAAPKLTSTSVLWRQTKVVGFYSTGQPGGRIAFSPDGTHVFVSAGDKQEFEPVQRLDNTIGKIIRLNADGSIPTDNPFVNVAGARPEIWSYGHRNPYGLVFDANGVLWENEMGPKGGDELNIVTRGANYGWPNVSYGDNYDGGLIPKPAAGDGYAPSQYWWTPVIAPSSMMNYTGTAFQDWTGDFIISGLQSKGLVIVDHEGSYAAEEGRIDLGQRTRDVVQGPDGSLWVIYDQPDGRLVKLTALAVSATSIRGDVGADGRSDILFRQANGSVAEWTSNGTSFDTAATFARGVGFDWTIVGTGDFNGNGKSDILWRNADGTVTTWLSNSTSFVDNDGGLYRKVSADWIVAGTGDFNGDGRTDILWRNVDGTVTDWLSTGVRLTDNPAAGRSTSTSQHVAGTGDFDGDGKDDVLWRGNDGAVTAWLSTGPAFADAVSFNHAMGLDWRIAGTGDFNGDGKTDILWRGADGAVIDWLSNGTAFVANSASSRPMGLDWQLAGVGDYSGDGKDDIVWRNVDGRVIQWVSTGTGFNDNLASNPAAPAALSVQQPKSGAEGTVFAQADFNGDGKDDILWRHANGTVTEWFGNGSGFTDNGTLARVVPAEWHVAALGDFNGDGKDDILWRAFDGTMIDWLSTGSGFADNAASAHAVAVDWRVEGTADFNGDGKEDILWRNADGTVTDWLSNGANFNDNSAFYRKVGLDWHIEATGDFNGDGKADILWRNADGTVTDWLSNGPTFADNGSLARAVPVDWQIVGVGDFNGDGKSDILWRNADGTLTDWLSTGTGFADNPAVSRGVPTDWQIAGIGDYNGDGRDDIFWRHANGQVIDWLSNGTGFTDNSASVRNVPIDWLVQHDATTFLI